MKIDQYYSKCFNFPKWLVIFFGGSVWVFPYLNMRNGSHHMNGIGAFSPITILQRLAVPCNVAGVFNILSKLRCWVAGSAVGPQSNRGALFHHSAQDKPREHEERQHLPGPDLVYNKPQKRWASETLRTYRWPLWRPSADEHCLFSECLNREQSITLRRTLKHFGSVSSCATYD